MKVQSPFYLISSLALFSALVSGCSARMDLKSYGNSSTQPTVDISTAMSINTGNPVCDPYDPTQPNYSNGLKGKIYYINQNQSSVNSVEQFFTQGVLSDSDLYLNRLNVPTQLWTEGFSLPNGDKVKDNLDNVLNEYFAFNLETKLVLRPQDQEGLYQLALLSDDGSKLEILNSSGGVQQTLINNDGLTQTRFSCANSTINMTHNSEVKVRVKYFQGPRNHIALMLLWRKVPNNNACSLQDSQCGIAGNNVYFDYNTVPSTPKSAFNGLLSRGWKVLAHENYKLDGQNNPCESL